MYRPLGLLLWAALAAAPLRADAPAGATVLFNGKDLSGWSVVTPTPTELSQVCQVSPDGTMVVAGKPVGYLLIAGTYTNYRFHAEWRWPADAVAKSNSGFLMHIASGPLAQNTWPLCFQVQTKLNRAGDLLPMAGAAFAEPLSTPPNAKTPQLDRRHPSSEKPLGEWNECDVLCRDGMLECTINGVLQNHVTGCKPAAGQIGVQLEGFPYEMRNIWISPL